MDELFASVGCSAWVSRLVRLSSCWACVVMEERTVSWCQVALAALVVQQELFIERDRHLRRCDERGSLLASSVLMPGILEMAGRGIMSVL